MKFIGDLSFVSVNNSFTWKEETGFSNPETAGDIS